MPRSLQQSPYVFLSTAAEGSVLTSLYQKTQTLLHLQTCLEQYLPPLLKGQCQVANWRDGCLVIAVKSAVWALHLRFASPDLLAALRKIPDFCAIRTIRHYVSAPFNIASRQKRSPLRLSEENAQLINILADSMEQNDLARRLKQLASRVHKNKKDFE